MFSLRIFAYSLYLFKNSHVFQFLTLFVNVVGSFPNGDENFVENKALLTYSKLSEGAEIIKPLSMAVSEFHFLLLLGNKVKVRCSRMSLIGVCKL